MFSIPPMADPDATWTGVNPLSRDPAYRDNPYPALNRAREENPVQRTPLGDYQLFRHADVVKLFKETKVGVRTTDGRLPGVDETDNPRRFMLQQDPPNHTRLRRLVSRGFTPPAMDRMRAEVQTMVDGFLDRASGGSTLDVIRDLARPLPSTVICQMIGVPLSDRELFTDWTAHVTHLLAPRILSEQQRAISLESAGYLVDYFTSLANARKQNLGDDLLSTLIRAEEAGDRLSHEELIVQAIGLLIAGFETTIGLIGNGVRALLMHPEELAKLRANPQLIVGAVEECLRYDGPIPGAPRVLHEDAVFQGIHLPKNTPIFAIISAAHRDPRVFRDPDTFNIERDQNANLAFGGGIHFCLGAHLARMEAQIAIGSLVRRFPKLALVTEKQQWGDSLFRIQSSLLVHI